MLEFELITIDYQFIAFWFVFPMVGYICIPKCACALCTLTDQLPLYFRTNKITWFISVVRFASHLVHVRNHYETIRNWIFQNSKQTSNQSFPNRCSYKTHHFLPQNSVQSGFLHRYRFTMRLFQSLQTFYRATGIYPHQSHRKCPINWKSLFIILTLIQFGILEGAYFLTKANSVDEYGSTFYTAISSFSSTMFFSINIWKMTEILRLIEKFEELINKSKKIDLVLQFVCNFDSNREKNISTGRRNSTATKNLYAKFNERIERISQFIYFILVKLSLAGMAMPALLITLGSYFILDLGDESFYLPSPMMWDIAIRYFNSRNENTFDKQDLIFHHIKSSVQLENTRWILGCAIDTVFGWFLISFLLCTGHKPFNWDVLAFNCNS